jgi:hypothetical protein
MTSFVKKTLQKIVEGLKNYQLLMKLAVSLVQGIS